MQLGAEGNFVGSGIFKSSDPERRARAIVEATTHFDDPERVAAASMDLGEPMRGDDIAELAARGRAAPAPRLRERPADAPEPDRGRLVVGVLACQGDFAAHAADARRARRRGGRGAHARAASRASTALVIPGGESHDDQQGDRARRARAGRSAAVTPAGQADPRHLRRDDRLRPRPPRADRRDRAPQRLRPPARRASRPSSRSSGPRRRAAARRLHPRAVDRVARRRGRGAGRACEGHPVAIREGPVLACSFHPELTDDPRVHALLMAIGQRAAQDRAALGEATARRLDADEGPAGREPGADPGRVLDPGRSEGDVCIDRGRDGRRAAGRRRSTRRCCEAGGTRSSTSLRGPDRGLLQHASDEQLDWISPVSEWAVEQRRRAGSRSMADTNTRELSGVAPERQTMRQAATRPPDGAGRWSAGRRGRATAGCYTLFPTNAYAADAEMSLRRLRGLLLPAPASPTTATRSPPGSGPPRRPTGSREWIEGHEEVRITGAGTDLTLGIAGPSTSSPATASTTCPTASSSPARSRTRPRARSPSTCRR